MYTNRMSIDSPSNRRLLEENKEYVEIQSKLRSREENKRPSINVADLSLDLGKVEPNFDEVF